LGLTLGCARCHDHKFDPIPTADYYSLAGVFKSTKTMDNFKVVARWQERPLPDRDAAERLRKHDEQVAARKAEVDALAKRGKDADTAALKKLRDELAALEKSRPAVPETMAVREGTPTNLRVHLRGSHLALGKEVPRQLPRILAGDKQTPIDGKQ